MLTPKMSVKRAVVVKHHDALVEELYAASPAARAEPEPLAAAA